VVKRIYHLAFAADWAEAQALGEYRVSTRNATLDDVGFIHCSFREQVAQIGALYYADVEEPLVVLVIDQGRVASAIKVEDGFPHIYGPLATSAVVEVERFGD
jgi:uncharacterized protein (DUF952 family)